MGTGAMKGQKKAEDLLDDIDPATFVPEGQTLLLQGLIWKLNTGASLDSKQDWLRRKMWVTSAGGLFYYSRQFDKPMGRSVAGLKVEVIAGKHCGRHTFRILPLPGSNKNKRTSPDVATVLGCEKESQRDEFMKQLRAIQDKVAEDTMGEDGLKQYAFTHTRTARARMSLVDADADAVMARQPSGRVIHRVAPYKAAAGASAKAPNLTVNNATGKLAPARHVDVRPSVGPTVFCSMKTEKSDALNSTLTSDSPPSPQHKVSRNSQCSFKEHTVLILDWDDTIFPTTWVRHDCRLNWRQTVAEQLPHGKERRMVEGLIGAFSERSERFMRAACSLASHVIIVTLAQRPWVETSAKNFLPALVKILNENKVKIVYARDYVSNDMEREYNAAEFRSTEEEANFWMSVKSAAMASELDRIHKAMGGSWKNIISMGDSDFERYALQKAAKEHIDELARSGDVRIEGLTSEVLLHNGHLNRLRTKTIKMLDEPSVEELTAEVELLGMWIQSVIQRDEGFDVVIDNTDNDAKLNDLNKYITGRSEKLTWVKLAGLA